MYVKIPHNLGVNNINLTLDYLQEEDSTHKFEEKEEDNNSFSTSFDLFTLNPGHKTFKSTGLIRTRQLSSLTCCL